MKYAIVGLAGPNRGAIEKKMPEDSDVEFVLYVAGELPNSQRAISNLQAFCREEGLTEFRVEILDVFKQPQQALSDKILITPQLVVRHDGRQQVIIGDLTDREAIRRAVRF